MLLHPVFWLTVALSLLLFRGAIGAAEESGLVVTLALLTGGLALGLLIASVLTANVAALRPRRDHLNELYGSFPAPAEARTGGVLTGLLIGPALVAVAVSIVSWFAFTQVPSLADDVDPFLAVQVPLAVIGLGALGVAVGRWIPSLLGGVLVILIHMFTGVIWIVPWIVPTSSDVGVEWHLAYLIAVPVMWSAIAFARDRRTVPRFAIGAAMFAIAIVAAIEQAPPGGY